MHLRLPHQVSKLNPKQYGPFCITKVISPIVYQLALRIAWRIHNTSHISLLSPYHKTPAHSPNYSWPPPDIVDGEEEQEIEHILGHQQTGQTKKLYYLIKWKGFPDSNNEWVDLAYMHTPDLIRRYHRHHPVTAIKAVQANRRGYQSPRRHHNIHPLY